jgi:thiosulfate/3-mercaptopyruvate sulfurtransferase
MAAADPAPSSNPSEGNVPRYVIIGAGALGVTLAAELDKAGSKVALIAKGGQLEAARTTGITYVTARGESQLDVDVYGGPEEIALRHDDLLVITTKTQDVATALAVWAHQPVSLHDGGTTTAGGALPLLTVQNGLETERVALRQFKTVFAGMLGIPAAFIRTGVVVNYGTPVHGVWWIGAYPDGPDPRLEPIATDLRHANFDTRIVDNISAWKNSKLVGASGFVLDALYEPSPLRDRAAALLRQEAAEIFAASGSAVAERMNGLMFNHADVPGYDRGGMSTWQSLNRSTSVETDYLNGEVVLQARLIGRAAPANEAAVERIHFLLRNGLVPRSLGDQELLEDFPQLEQQDRNGASVGAFNMRPGLVGHSQGPGILIEPAELDQLLSAATRPVVLDVRWKLGDPDGRRHYEDGHIPTAVYVDLDSELAAAPSAAEGRHPLPQLNDLEQAAQTWGLNNGQTVVVYDDNGGMSAARAWWLLRWAGVKDVRILNGALAAWLNAGLRTETGQSVVVAGDVNLEQGRLPVLDADAAAEFPDAGVLLDARAPERYRGDREPVDPRAGHIPGAVNAPTSDNLGADGRFLTAAELRARFAGLGVNGVLPVGAYCGSGVTAAHLIAALNVAGIDAALFSGSWSAWSSDPDRPLEVGETAGLADAIR